MRFRWERRFKIGAVFALLLLLIGLGLLLLPVAARHIVETRLEESLESPVSIGDVDLNLFTGRAALSNLVIGDPKAERPILRLPTVDFHFSLFALFRRSIRLYDLQLIQPQLLLERTGPARFNVTELFDLSEDESDDAGPAVTIEEIAIRDGKILFTDRTVSPPSERRLENVTLKAGRISSLPDLTSKPTAFELGFRIGRASVAMTGKATPLAQPIGIEVAARWKGLDPAIFEAYLPSQPVVDFTEGRSSGEARYLLTREGERAHSVTASLDTGPASLRPSKEGEALLTAVGVGVRGLNWDFLGNRARIDELVLRQPRLVLEKDSAGVFTVAKLFDEGERAAPAEERPEETEAPSHFSFQIARLKIETGTVDLLDRQVSPPVKATLKELQLSLEELVLMPESQPARLKAEGLLGKAPIQATGTLQPSPFRAQLRITAKDVPLESYQGYLRSAWKTVDQWQGRLDSQIDLRLASRQDDALNVELGGDFALRELTLGLSDNAKPFFRAEKASIQLSGLRTHPSFFMDLRHVELSGAHLRIERDRDGELNLKPLWGSPKGADATPKASARPSRSETPFTIQKLLVTKSSVEFTDATVAPLFKSMLSNLNIETGKMGRQAGRTPLTFRAALDDSAALELKGWITAFNRPLRIQLDGAIRDYDLSHLNPYASQYIQYEIERGRVTTDVAYGYDTGDLDGKNELAIRHLQLGERRGDEFEKQIGISLKLALALLEDLDGRIRLTVPVKGDLNEPQFTLGNFIWKSVRNALIQFLSAPLRLLGNVVTLGGKITEIRIDPVEFAPGSAQPGPDGNRRLRELAELLKNKPRLELELRGFAAARDLKALKQQRLREEIAKTSQDYQNALARLYRQASGIPNSAKLPSRQVMESFLADRLTLPQNTLPSLAQKRVEAVKNLLTTLGVEPKRLLTATPDAAKAGEKPSGRVEFQFLS